MSEHEGHIPLPASALSLTIGASRLLILFPWLIENASDVANLAYYEWRDLRLRARRSTCALEALPIEVRDIIIGNL